MEKYCTLCKEHGHHRSDHKNSGSVIFNSRLANDMKF